MRKKRPFFSIHDYNEFEMDKKEEGPRWKLNVDSGATGKWAKGIVTDIDLHYIQMDAIYPDGEVRTTRFPNYASSDYDKEQWWRVGYLQHADKEEPQCECGMGRESGTHYMFCPMHEWLRVKDREAEEKAQQERKATRSQRSAFRP